MSEGKKLTQNREANGAGIKLPRPQEALFRISISERLDHGYEIKDMENSHIKELHKFIADTVYKRLTISQVDDLYLRKQRLGVKPTNCAGEELSHYGKDGNPFRLFGYYNQDGYFVISRIDGKHKTHRA